MDKSLWVALSDEKVLNESVLARYVKQMLAPIARCHSLGIVRRDINPDNFLSNHGLLKLCDFGPADMVPMDRLGKSCNNELKGKCGAAAFMAPEMLAGKCYGPCVNMWSLGVLVYTLIFGQLPYTARVGGKAAIKQAILDGSPKPTFKPTPLVHVSANVSEAAQTFVKVLLNRDEFARTEADQALSDPWLQE